jgi:toxin FitB
MKIFDSNILIHAIQPEHNYLLVDLFDDQSFVSVISKLEVLGYHLINEKDKLEFENIFNLINVIQISPEIIEKAVEIKQQKKMSLGDSVVAATALIIGLEINTRNISDFKHLPLTVINPMI